VEEWKVNVGLDKPDFRPKVEFHGVESDVPPAMGSPSPLGATVVEKGVNFAVASESAKRVQLLIFDQPEAKQPSRTVDLTRTDNTWHAFVADLGPGAQYLYRVHGDYTPAIDGSRANEKMALIDPYSKAVTGGTNGPLAFDNSNPVDANRHLKKGTTDSVEEMPRSIVLKAGEFDWKGDKPPNIHVADSDVLEVNLRGFTAGEKHLGVKAGTYLGLYRLRQHHEHQPPASTQNDSRDSSLLERRDACGRLPL